MQEIGPTAPRNSGGYLCSNGSVQDSQQQDGGLASLLPTEWLFGCCTSNRLQRCAEATLAQDSRARPAAPEVRPLIRNHSRGRDVQASREKSIDFAADSGSPANFRRSRRRAPDSRHAASRCYNDVSLPMPDRPSARKLGSASLNTFESRGLASPSAVHHEGNPPRTHDQTNEPTWPPLPGPPQEQDANAQEYVPRRGLEDDVVKISADVQAQAAGINQLEVSATTHSHETVASGVTRVLLASFLTSHPSRGRGSHRDVVPHIQEWCQKCGLEEIDVLADHKELEASAIAMAERCKPGDTCALLLTGLRAASDPGTAAPEEERGEEGASMPLLGSDFWAALPSSSALVCISDLAHALRLSDAAELRSAVAEKEGVKCAAPVILFTVSPGQGCPGTDADVSTWSHLCASSMMRAADALSLADGPCKVSCGDFFAEMTEQARDLADDWNLPEPSVLLQSSPDSSSACSARWPLSRAPRELAREVGANNTAATQTWVRTGAHIIPRPLPKIIFARETSPGPELHRPLHRSASPVLQHRRPAGAAEKHAAAVASVASEVLASARAAVAGSAALGALGGFASQMAANQSPRWPLPNGSSSARGPDSSEAAEATETGANIVDADDASDDFNALIAVPALLGPPPSLHVAVTGEDEAPVPAGGTLEAPALAAAAEAAPAAAAAPAPAAAASAPAAPVAASAPASAALAVPEQLPRPSPAPSPQKEIKEQRRRTSEKPRGPRQKEENAPARHRSASARTMPQNFGGLQLLLSGGGKLRNKKPAGSNSTTAISASGGAEG